jgi:hypothetical protein
MIKNELDLNTMELINIRCLWDLTIFGVGRKS